MRASDELSNKGFPFFQQNPCLHRNISDKHAAIQLPPRRTPIHLDFLPEEPFDPSVHSQQKQVRIFSTPLQSFPANRWQHPFLRRLAVMRLLEEASSEKFKMHLHQQLHFILQGRPRDVSTGCSEDVGGAWRCWECGSGSRVTILAHIPSGGLKEDCTPCCHWNCP